MGNIVKSLDRFWKGAVLPIRNALTSHTDNTTVHVTAEERTAWNAGIVYYGTCGTAAATQAKAVTISGVTALSAGLSIRVKFTNAQTYNGAPTLNVSELGAKSIMRNGTTAAARYEWLAGEVVDFIYDGTNWVIADGGVATTTYYGVTKLSSSTSSTSTALAATPSAVKAAYDLANGKQDALTFDAAPTANSTNPVTSGGVYDELASVTEAVVTAIVNGTYSS